MLVAYEVIKIFDLTNCELKNVHLLNTFQWFMCFKKLLINSFFLTFIQVCWPRQFIGGDWVTNRLDILSFKNWRFQSLITILSGGITFGRMAFGWITLIVTLAEWHLAELRIQEQVVESQSVEWCLTEWHWPEWWKQNDT